MKIKLLNLATQDLTQEPLSFLETQEKVTLWKDETSYLYFAIENQTTKAPSLQVNGLKEDQVRLYQVQETTAHIGRGMIWGEIPEAPNADFKDRLVPYENGDAISSSIWCLAYTGNEPGNFIGEVALCEEGKILATLGLSFEVLPLALPKEDSYGLELWQYPFAVARYYQIEPKDYFQAVHLERLTENLALYQAAGGDTIVTTIVHDPWNHQTYDAYPSLIKWTKKSDQFTFDFTWFDTYVDLNIALGIDQKIKCFSMLPWEDKIYFYDEIGELQEVRYPVGSKEWCEIWSQFLSAFVTHLEEKGWFEQTYIAIDERPAEVLTSVFDLLNKHPNRDGKRLKVSCAMNYQNFDPTLLDQIADLSIGQAHLGDKEAFRKLCQVRREKGLFTSIYNCVGDYPSMFLYSHPFESQWIVWNAIAYDADGFLRWALDAWVEDPAVNASHWYWESGDPFLIYPEGEWSVRYQQLIKALVDSQKYQFLKTQDEKYVTELDHYLRALPMLEGRTNAYGAQVAKSEENQVLLADHIATIQTLLEQATKDYLKECALCK